MSIMDVIKQHEGWKIDFASFDKLLIGYDQATDSYYQYEEIVKGVKKLGVVYPMNFEMFDGACYKNAIGDQVYFGYILDMDFTYSGKIDEDFFEHIRAYQIDWAINESAMFIDDENQIIVLERIGY